MQIQSSGLTLFDYLEDADKSNQTLQNLAQNQYQYQDLRKELNTLTDSLNLGQTDNPLKFLDNGFSNVSLKTVNNMIAYNMRPVAEDLQQMADRFGIKDPVNLQNVDGKWQVDGLMDEEQLAAATPEEKATQEQLQNLQTYLDKNTALQDKLTQLDRMSEFYEFGQTQEYAKTLQANDVAEDGVVSYLTASRSLIQEAAGFSLSSKGLQLNSRGESDSLIEQAKEQFNIKDES
ncbi:hypothetical protein [Neptunicella marina]|uniref:Uncharacterized protein n=1 Tax=Neptunicella marina TaxID=2125989 RepID=A0A8J6IUA9_9ALTE|nr:hypothetical protein [Neptunicella marina]MBC3765975.1 hypothetical protein [Neptunicella marina]